MAKVYMTCGKLCSGKTAYAAGLRNKNNAVILSVDEITLSLFPEGAGDRMDEYVRRTQDYLYGKSLEVIASGNNVILDWGFWTSAEREYARRFYSQNKVSCELHYLDISDELWKQRIAARNQLVSEGKVSAYYVDKGLEEKFAGIFQIPDESEIDKRIIIR